jgi:hypothetical protein
VSECDREILINGDHGPTTGRSATGKKFILLQEMREMILLLLAGDQLEAQFLL